MKVPCTQCGIELDVQEMAEPRIHNSVLTSLLIVEHPKPLFCLQCKVPVALVLTNVNLQMSAMPIKRKGDSPILVVPGMPSVGKR